MINCSYWLIKYCLKAILPYLHFHHFLIHSKLDNSMRYQTLEILNRFFFSFSSSVYCHRKFLTLALKLNADGNNKKKRNKMKKNFLFIPKLWKFEIWIWIIHDTKQCSSNVQAFSILTRKCSIKRNYMLLFINLL